MAFIFGKFSTNNFKPTCTRVFLKNPYFFLFFWFPRRSADWWEYRRHLFWPVGKIWVVIEECHLNSFMLNSWIIWIVKLTFVWSGELPEVSHRKIRFFCAILFNLEDANWQLSKYKMQKNLDFEVTLNHHEIRILNNWKCFFMDVIRAWGPAQKGPA